MSRLKTHREIIIALGGTTQLARRLGIGQNVTANWLTRGVPWHWRPEVARIAKTRGLTLPNDFLAPPKRAAAASSESARVT